MKKISLAHYAGKNIRGYMIALSMIALSTLSRVLAPTLLSRIIDEVVGNGNLSVFPRLLALMALFYTLPGVVGYIQEVTSDSISKRVCCDLRNDVFSSISLKDGEFFASRTPADLMSRTTSDTDSIGFIFGFCGLFIVEIICLVLSQFYALARVSLKCALVPLVCLPVIAFLAFKSEMKGDKLSDAISDKRADLNQAASEAIMGIRTVKSFGREDKENARFRHEAGIFRNISRSFDFLWVHWCTPESVIALMMVPLTILIGGLEVIGGRMTLGDLTAAVQYTNELSWPMMEIGWLFIEVSSARAGWRKVKAIMENEPKIRDGEKTVDTSRGTLSFNHVSFRSGDRTLLDDVSFTIEPGKTVAVMGASGSGKSLVTSLAVRSIDPTSGSVTIDGVDLRDMTLSSARGFSSIVTQDVFLFSDTVGNNIALGERNDYDKDEMMAAARSAEASEFIEKLENGWDTVIGERGVGLSGGQKQRLSIARAFMRKNQLLILDDATSALDMETEREIEKTIRREGSRSLLITAHRISAVKNADEIIVLENGKVAERGTHNELLRKKGLYWETYISQYPEEEERA
jgi:ATP-binding cassette, subfamily B, multidrug efflux pump